MQKTSLLTLRITLPNWIQYLKKWSGIIFFNEISPRNVLDIAFPLHLENPRLKPERESWLI